MNKTIAITGATGFAGGHAVAELLRRGHAVRALVRNPAAARLPGAVTLVEGSLASEAALVSLVQGADAVVHLAGAIAAVTAEDFFKVNARGTTSLAAAAVRANVSRFIHVSSLAARQPALSPYGASKRAGEEAVLDLATKLNALILRPPAVYGPGDRATLPLLKALTQAVAVIPSRRESRFSLIHVADLARIIADAAVSDATGVFEVSDGREGGYGWGDLMAVASDARGAPVRPVFLPRPLPGAFAWAAEAVARFTGRPGLVNRGKIAELYHPDWVTRDGGLVLDEPITFAHGFPATLAWYRDAGWLPPAAGADTSRTQQNRKTGS